MSNATIPSALYKYLAPNLDRASQILGDLRIRFSQVSVLNDFDEFKPHYGGFATHEGTVEISREFLLRKYPSECGNVYRNFSIDQADLVINETASNSADNLEKFHEKIAREVYAKLDRDTGLLSLSEILTSRLMWTFYSDEGWGVVIEFDPSHAWFNCKTADNDSFHHLRQVRYVVEREPMYLLDPQADMAKREDAVLYTKTCEWEFEQEWRIIRNLNEGEKQPDQDKYKKDVWLFEIPPSAIQAVVFGYRTTSDLEKSLREIVTANENLKHIVFRRAVRDVNGHIEIVPAQPVALREGYGKI